MKPITAEWVEKAEGDYGTMERETRARKRLNLDGLCFHAQQCAEKYLKAVAVEADRSYVRTHDWVILLEGILDLHPDWDRFREDMAYLTYFAVSFRYPGESTDRSTALDARNRCRSFRRAARAALGLPD